MQRSPPSPLSPPLAPSTLGAVAVGFAFLAAFRTHATATVWAMVYFKVATIFALAVVVVGVEVRNLREERYARVAAVRRAGLAQR